MTTPATVVIVDDEPPARQRLLDLVAARADLELVAACATGSDAVAAIEAHAPDLVLLDVQMPEVDGFDVLAALQSDRLPLVVFVSAYDRHALRAFEVNALDYLLKPYSDERFHQAVGRALELLRTRRGHELGDRLAALLAARAPADVRRLLVRDAGRITFIDVGQIDWIDGAGVYVEIHAGADTFLHRETLAALESKLDPARFVRIHRSTIVNLERVRQLHPRTHGEYDVVLEGGATLKLSRSYRANLERLLQQRL